MTRKGELFSSSGLTVCADCKNHIKTGHHIHISGGYQPQGHVCRAVPRHQTNLVIGRAEIYGDCASQNDGDCKLYRPKFLKRIADIFAK
jgi:hypothetical protein